MYAFPGPHYVLGGIPSSGSSQISTSDCPKLGFDSVDGVKTLIKGDDGNNDGVVRFDFTTDRPYKLHDVLKVFDDVEANTADSFDLEYNSCVHFILRMIRPLGIRETKEFGEFLVDTILADDNFLHLARKNHGGTAAMAARVLGTEVFRDYVENLVFSQLEIPDGRNLRRGGDEMIGEAGCKLLYFCFCFHFGGMVSMFSLLICLDDAFIFLLIQLMPRYTVSKQPSTPIQRMMLGITVSLMKCAPMNYTISISSLKTILSLSCWNLLKMLHKKDASIIG